MHMNPIAALLFISFVRCATHTKCASAHEIYCQTINQAKKNLELELQELKLEALFEQSIKNMLEQEAIKVRNQQLQKQAYAAYLENFKEALKAYQIEQEAYEKAQKNQEASKPDGTYARFSYQERISEEELRRQAVLAKLEGYYKVLELPMHASREAIKQAYKKLARKYHPDKNPEDPKAKEKFQALVNAYKKLLEMVPNGADTATHTPSNDTQKETPKKEAEPSDAGVLKPLTY